MFRFLGWLLFVPELRRSLSAMRGASRRVRGSFGALWTAPAGRSLALARFGTRRGLAAGCAGLLLVLLGTGLGVEAALAQSVDAGIFDVMDQASRDLVAFLRGGGTANAGWNALGEMVFYFNAGMLVLAGLLLVYYVAAGVLDTARQGRFGFGVWEVVRIVAAVALLAPLPGGPSGGQHMVLGLAGLGGDFAQGVWKPFAGVMIGGSKVVGPKLPENGGKLMMANALSLEVCLYLAGPRRGGPGSSDYMKIETVSGTEVWRYLMDRDRRGFDERSHCGEIRFPGIELGGARGEVASAHREGMRAARVALIPVAARLGRPYVDEAWQGRPMESAAVLAGVETAFSRYSGIVDPVVARAGKAVHRNMSVELTGQQAQDGSWTTAGSVFNVIAKRVGDFNWSVVSGPEITPPMLALEDQDNEIFRTVSKIFEDISTAVGSPVGRLGNVAPGVGASGGGESGLLNHVFYAILFSFDDVLVVGQDNPLLDLAVIGHRLVMSVQIAAGVLMGMAQLSNLADVSFLGTSVKALDVFEAVWPVIDGLVTMLLTVMLIGGAVLAYLVPAIPFIMFLFALLGWLLAVIEAFISMAVWLAAQTVRSEGDGLTTRSMAGGLLMLAGIVLRPPLMILGLILGYFVFVVVIGLFNEIWVPQMRTATGDAGAGVAQFVVMLVLYIIIVYGLLRSCMGLIEGLPNGVMEWIGGRARGDRGADDVIGVASGASGRMSGFSPRVTAGSRRGGRGGSAEPDVN